MQERVVTHRYVDPLDQLWIETARAIGLREPLPYAPYSAWAYFSCDKDEASAVAAARAQWHGGGNGGYAEGQGEAIGQVLRGRDPFADDALLLRFADLAMTVFLALRAGQVYQGVDADALAGLAARFEPEDGE